MGRSRRIRISGKIVAAALLLGLTGPPGSPAAGQVTAPTEAGAALIGLDGAQIGTATFAVEGDRLRIEVDVTGLEPGFHGFHIHTTGTCDPAAKFVSAGGHFNPSGDSHGAHAGDLPPLYVRPDRTGRARFTTDRITVAQLLDADGAAVMVHANPDNFANIPSDYQSSEDAFPGADAMTKTHGDAGDRLACGVVTTDRRGLPGGYFLGASDGGIFAFGGARYGG
ncbi:MAG TPA: superoxide dismutase family protein, partial [Acidimicrobiia bacterium]|nr:superoxide dismutase family protein [Acidimicrobiia bacterium]